MGRLALFLVRAMDWTKVDDNHSICKVCGDCFHNADLSQGYCSKCISKESERQERALRRSGKRIVSKSVKASAQFLAALENQGKTGASMPRVMSEFWKHMGGEEKFGELMTQEFNKTLGVGLDADDIETWVPSTKFKLQWFEMICRYAAKTDEKKTLDIGSLDEADLDGILADIGRRAVMEDAEIRDAVIWSACEEDANFRKRLVMGVLKEDPKLLNEILDSNGIITVEPDPPREELPDNKEVEETLDFEDEAYTDDE